jgi:hypothetical protein
MGENWSTLYEPSMCPQNTYCSKHCRGKDGFERRASIANDVIGWRSDRQIWKSPNRADMYKATSKFP